MGRKRLVEVEPEDRSTPATTRVVAARFPDELPISEVRVEGAKLMVTIPVDAVGDGFKKSEGKISGSHVRLKPVGLCGAEDLEWAENRARKLGALTVTRMSLLGTSTTPEPGVEEELDSEVATTSVLDVVMKNLDTLMRNEGCDEVEITATKALAQELFDQVGG